MGEHGSTGRPSAPWPRRGIDKIDQFTWLVPSRSHPGDWHTVRWQSDPKQAAVYLTCSCPAGRGSTAWMGDRAKGYERPCRHITLVAEAEQDDGLPPLSKGEMGDPRRFTE